MFHVDGNENVHCVLDGNKTFYLVHPSYQDVIEQDGDEGEAKGGKRDGGSGGDASIGSDIGDGGDGSGGGGDGGGGGGGGGGFGWDFDGDCSRANMSALDLVQYPGFATLPYTKVELMAGDCLYVTLTQQIQTRLASNKVISQSTTQPINYATSCCKQSLVSLGGARESCTPSPPPSLPSP